MTGTPERTGWGEWDAAVHLLTAPLFHGRNVGHIHPDRRIIDWNQLLDQPWSASEALLVLAAHDLWNGDGDVNLYDLVNRLDDTNFARLLEAIRLARGRR